MPNMDFDQILQGRSLPDRRRIVLEYLHELTIEARDLDEMRKLKGLVEVMHTLAGTLLRSGHDDEYLVGETIRDKGQIYDVTDNLLRACRRLAGRKGY